MNYSLLTLWRLVSVVFAIFLVGGLGIGVAASVFTALSQMAHHALHRWVEAAPYLPLLVMPAAFALILWVTRKFFRAAQGGGIPQTLATLEKVDPDFRQGLLSFKNACAKVVLTPLGQLCGAPVGREAPMIYVGAAILYTCSRYLPHHWHHRWLDQHFILAGAGAGLAAAFSTPIAGVVFVIEELVRFRTQRAALMLLILVTVIASFASNALITHSSFFGHSSSLLALSQHWLEILVCGVVCGFAGGLFSRAMLNPGRLLPAALERLRTQAPIRFAALCGLVIAVMGVLSQNTIYGSGAQEAQQLMVNAGALPMTYALLKFAATLLVFFSGIPGGIFAPSLAIGAGIGANLALLFTHLPSDALILLCIAGFFAGMVQAPLTACIIVMEMNRSADLALPLLAVSLIAWVCAKQVCREPVYHALARRFLAVR